MKSFTCTNINKDNGDKIISYVLQDSAGKTIQVSYNKLKLMLESKKIAVVNLTIKNNEIIEDPEYQIKSLMAKLKMFGKTYKSDCGHDYYVIESPDTTIVCIPDDVKYLIKSNNEYEYPDFCNIECNTLKVIGGSGLTSTYNIFGWCEAQSIDLSSFDTSKVTDMYSMFCDCEAKSIDLSSFDTSKVTNMRCMFEHCEAQSLDFSSFDTSKVTDMSWMFYYCESQSLDLSLFDTSKVADMTNMFWGCEANYIDLSSFNAINVENMENIFNNCHAQVKVTDNKILAELSKRD